MTDKFELKHIRGIPYYLSDNRVYTFELDHGLPSEKCIQLGVYNPDTNSITYRDNWEERIQPNLTQFREQLVSKERKNVNDGSNKPLKKSRKPVKTPRKSSTKAKSVKAE